MQVNVLTNERNITRQMFLSHEHVFRLAGQPFVQLSMMVMRYIHRLHITHPIPTCTTEGSSKTNVDMLMCLMNDSNDTCYLDDKIRVHKICHLRYEQLLQKLTQ